MNISFYFLVFFCAATISSFICLAVERLPHQLRWRDEPIENLSIWWPPSHCNNCKKRIGIIGLIPFLGYFLSLGRCHHCGYKIPLLYPLIEFFGGLACVSIFIYSDDLFIGFLISSVFLSLLFLSLIDAKESWLPACVTYPLFWSGLLISPFSSAYEKTVGAFSACFIMYLSMKLVGLIKKRDVFAGGDIALSAAAGAWIGIERVPEFLLVTSFTFITYAIPFRLKDKVFVPMGPAISVGFFLCLILIP